MLCSRTDRDAAVACLVSGPQLHATPRLQQGLRVSKLHCHWVPSFGEPADDSGERLAARPAETTQMIGGQYVALPLSTHSFFITGHRSVRHRLDILGSLGRVPVQGCLQFKGVNSDHMPP